MVRPTGHSIGAAAGLAAPAGRWIAKTARGRRPLGVKRLLCVIPPVALTTVSIVLLVMALGGAVSFQGDFNGDLYLAGTRIFHGLSPYEPRVIAAAAAIVKAGGTISAVPSPRYPAPMLVASAPLSLLPLWLADGLFVVLSIASVIGGLRLLGVRDWRCFAVACLSWPVVFGVWLGNISPLILLGSAVVWRCRARVLPAAAAVASVIAAKLILWPLGVWLLVTRRFGALALAILLAIAAAAAGWAVVGFSSLIEYPRLLMNIAAVGEGRGCSLVASLMSVGVSPAVARIAALICATGLLGAAWRFARLPDGDRHAFGVIVMAVLIATPVAWAHYLVLTFIPIAFLSPRLSWIWFLPMLAGLEPTPVGHPQLWASLPTLVIELLLLHRLCSPLLIRLSSAPASAESSRNAAYREHPGGPVTELGEVPAGLGA
jgi:Glycosyltransferase family 87